MDHTEVAKTCRQIPPGNTCTVAVKYGIDEQSVVLDSDTDRVGTTRQQRAKALPLLVGKPVSCSIFACDTIGLDHSGAIGQDIDPLIDDRP